MAIKDYHNEARQDIADLQTHEINGARESAQCAKIHISGAWEDVWQNSLEVVENGTINSEYEEELARINKGGTIQSEKLTCLEILPYQTTYADYPDAILWVAHGEWEFQNGTGSMYYFDTKNFDSLALVMSVDCDYYQRYSNSYWNKSIKFEVYSEGITEPIGTLTESGTLDISAYDTIGIKIDVSCRLEIKYDEEYFNSVKININTLKFE